MEIENLIEDVKNLIGDVKKLKYYHGQIYKFWDFKKKEPKYFDVTQLKSPVSDALKILLDNFKISLYYHQGELVKNITENKDTIICMNEGSGKGLGIDIGVILNVLLAHKTVLYLRPFDLEMRLNVIRQRIARSGWNWIIRSEKANNAEELSHFLDQMPDIIVTTPETIAEYYLTIYSIEKESSWLNSLGLLVIEDITLYTPEDLSHLQNLISALTFGQRDHFQILLSANEIENPERFAFQLTNRSMSAITTDFSLKNPFRTFIWIPYLDSKPTEDKRLKVERQEYLKELEGCIKFLCKSGDNILIWHLFERIGASELTKIKESLLISLKDIHPQITITVCENLRSVPKDMFRKFNKIFILGLYCNIENLRDTLGNLLSENGLTVVIPCESPLSYFHIREPERTKKINRAHIIISENDDLKEYYFLRSLCSSPSPVVEIKKLSAIWGKNFSERIINKLKKEGFIESENEKIIITNREAIYELTNCWRWGVFDKEIFELHLYESGTTRKMYFGKYLFPHLIYPGAIYFHGVDKYQIPLDLVESSGELRLDSSSVMPLLTVPIIKYSIEYKSSKDDLTQELNGFCKIAFLSKVEIEVEFQGYKHYNSLEYKKGRILTRDKSIKIKKKMPVLKISEENIDDIKILFPIFSIFLPTYFVNFERLFDLYADTEKKGIFIIPIVPMTDECLKELHSNLSTIIPEIYENAYNLLITCPCVNGCPLCLKSMKSPEDIGPIKTDLIRTLAKALKKEQEAEFIIKKKEKGLGITEAEKTYANIQQKILDLFKKKLTLEIKNKARLCVEKLEGASGLYCGDTIKVIPDIPEAYVYEVIAHEYAHNWEFEEGNMCADLMDSGKVPFNGKLITEGFAQWVAFKTLDFYGLADYMEAIDLREYDEYGEGFNLLKWIEDNVAGFHGVIDFVKTGKVLDPETNIEYDLKKLLAESGIGDKIK